MIKKTTQAIFLDGAYKGEYDWKGGIPLSVGEKIQVQVEGQNCDYVMVEKTVNLNDVGEDQLVAVVYTLQLAELSS